MGWESNVRLACKMENNNNDDTGNYTPVDVGTPKYSTTVKHDDAYSLERNDTGTYYTNCIALPSALMTDINGYNTFSISFWAYHDTSKQFALYVSKGTQLIAGFLWAYTDKNNNLFVYRWNGINHNLSEFNGTTEVNTWINWAFTWDGTAGGNGTLKVYKNNSLIDTVATVPSSFGAQNTNFAIAGGGFGSGTLFLYMDNFIITNDIPASFPITEVFGVVSTNRILTRGTFFSNRIRTRGRF